MLFFIHVSFLSMHACAKKYYTFHEINYNENVSRRFYADLDGDGVDEYINLDLQQTGALVIDIDKGIPVTMSHLAGRFFIENVLLFDFIGDDAPEIIVVRKEVDMVWLDVYAVERLYGSFACVKQFSTEPVHCQRDVNEDKNFDITVRYGCAADLNGDDVGDLIIGIDTGIDLEPRGIYTYDGTCGEKLWQFDTAGQPQNLYVNDHDQDGENEIVFVTYSPDNGHSANFMDDTHAYLICLNSNGNLEWKHMAGGRFFTPHFNMGDLDHDQKNEIVNVFASGHTNTEYTTYNLQIRKIETGKVQRQYALNGKPGAIFIADINQDGEPEILTSCFNPEKFSLLLFSNSLQLLQHKKMNQHNRFVFGEMSDFDFDDRPEIIACDLNKLFILDNRFRRIASKKMPYAIHNLHLVRNHKYDPLINVGQMDAGTFRGAYLLHPAPDLFAFFTNQPPATYIVAALLTLPLLFLPFRKTIKRTYQHRSKSQLTEQRDSLLQILAAFGHGQTALANLDRLGLLFRNAPGDVPPEYTQRLNETTEAFRQFTAPQLEQIVKKAVAAQINDRIVHSFSTASSRLLEHVKSYQSQSSIAHALADSIPKYVEAVQKELKNIQGELKADYTSDIVTAIKTVITATTPDMQKQGVELKQVKIDGSMTVKGFIHAMELQSILEELVRNAIHAMQQSEKKELTVHISSKDAIVIDIADTGCGMNDDIKSKIFDRDVTSKKEGGYGLYHAKNILQKYGGKLRVQKTESGGGTTMRLILKEV
ncbi:GHKL domain-containing protein [candidate division KSB1 bacterium]|nr:GHKL domain-containing protein [candidate division KSB1 bacterium]